MKKKEDTGKRALRQVLKDYMGQCRQRPWDTAIGFTLPAIGSILIFFVPPLIVARLVDMFGANGQIPTRTLIENLALLGGSWILGESFWRIGMNSIIKMQGAGITNLSKIAFDRLLSKDYTFYTNNFAGSLTKRAHAYSRNFESVTDTLNFSVISNIFPLIFASIILWRYSPWITIVLIGFLGTAVVIAIPIIRRRAQLVAIRHEAGSVVSGRLSDSISNMQTIKSFAHEPFEAKVYAKHVDDLNKKWKDAAHYHNRRIDTVFSPIYVLTNVIGLMMAIIFAGKLALPAGAIIVVFTYYSRITLIIWQINHVYRSLESGLTEAMEFAEMFLEEPAIKDIPHALPLVATDGAIAFTDVEFGYEEAGQKKETFLKNFNLVIPKNQKVGLVGPSGGGKTTITKLLLRFIDIHAGAITIDGQDISKVSQQSLRKAIAYVPQEPLLFHRSLFENIAYGMEGATREQVVTAARLARADEFIDKLPHGYDTQVGERGIKLSGGQRQRVAIARAILKHSFILVLDEATSALDSESEKYIQEGLVELMKDKTTLVIAHRLSTIKHLDRIIVLDDGKIIEDGTHAELIKQNGMYATLWGHQSGEFI